MPNAWCRSLAPFTHPPSGFSRTLPRKLKAKEAKNVGDILELAKGFRPLADAYVATFGRSSATEASVEGAGNDGESAFSRLSMGLAVRQVTCPTPLCQDKCILLRCSRYRAFGRVTRCFSPTEPTAMSELFFVYPSSI